MQVSSISNNEYRYGQVGRKQIAETESHSTAVTEVATEGEGTFLGLTMIPEEGKSVVYGMRAMLSEESTPDRPIVQIISNLDGKKEVFNVDISQVDPENATRMEMFALCSYADKMGQGTGSTFGSFQTLKICEETANLNGVSKVVNAAGTEWEAFQTEKIDWPQLVEQVCDIWKESTNAKVLDLFSKGKKLLGMFEKYLDTVIAAMPTQPINVIECSVMSFPDTDYSFYYNHSTGELDCVKDNSGKAGRDILWSKEISEIDYENCGALFERYKGETTWEYKYEAYLAHEDFWDMYLNGDVDMDALRKADELLTGDDLFNKLFENVPETVKTAWEEALMEVGSVFSMDKDGNVNYFSELYRQIFVNATKGNDFEVLGNTEEAALEYATNAIDNLSDMTGYSDSVRRMREKEIRFYNAFIDKL